MKLIEQNPYRVLGVLSNSPLKDRVGNQNRLAAFAKVGKEVTFPNDFLAIIPKKPNRTAESISAANVALNLDKDQLKHALVWFINGSPIDSMAIKYIQAGNTEKARELFDKKETFSSLINVGVLHLISEDFASGFSNISMVIHNDGHRSSLLKALGLENLTMSEDEIATMFIEEMLTEVPASTLLSVASNPNDKALIGKIALDEPISAINAAISAAKSVNSKDADANLEAGTKLMKSTKKLLKQVKDIAGVNSPQYQMIADNLAKAILQCGINYYNNAPDSDIESPRKAIVLQEYALKIAVGQLAKQRCQENYDIIKKAVDNMPPTEVAIEARKVKDELRKFCSLPDKIEYSINLLNATKPLLQTIKSKLGASNAFYLSLSTQVVGNALHNLIEEVNQAQNYLSAIVKAAKEAGLDPAMLNYLGDEHSPANIINNKLKPVLRQAWKATTIMDSFDMESDFKVNRYNQNRSSLKDMCDSLDISTSSWSTRTTLRPSAPRTTSTTTYTTSKSSSSNLSGSIGCITIIICSIIGCIIGLCYDEGWIGFLVGAILIGPIVGSIVSEIMGD
jgi:hypothetical protein